MEVLFFLGVTLHSLSDSCVDFDGVQEFPTVVCSNSLCMTGFVCSNAFTI